MVIKMKEGESIIENENYFSVFETRVSTRVVCEYELYLTGEVGMPACYSELLAFLSELEEEDTLTIKIASFGGSCHGCVALINGIKECSARVEVEVMAPSYSAGATLALCGDSLHLHPHTFLMFHNYSSSQTGKGNELVDALANCNKWIHDYFEDLHIPFLTKSESRALMNDKDVYVHWDDKVLGKRLKRHFKKENKNGK